MNETELNRILRDYLMDGAPLPPQFLIEAAKNGSLSLVQRILSLKNPDGSPLVSVYAWNRYGDTALHMAARYGHLDVVQYLVGLRAAKGNPLVGVVRYLLGLRAANEYPLIDVNQANFYGEAALHCAAANGHLDVVQYLVELRDANGNPLADVKQRDMFGRAALNLAAMRGHLAVVRYLVELRDAKGNPLVDVNQRDNDGRTALHLAAQYRRLDVLQYLVELRDANGYPLVDVNAKDVLPFIGNNPEMQRLLRAIGQYEKPKETNEPERVLQNADEHGQNVHSWFDVKCGAINLEALLDWRKKLNIARSTGDAFAELKRDIEKQIDLLLTAGQLSAEDKDKLILALIPPDYPRPQTAADFKAIADKLGAALRDFERLRTPEEWRSYLDLKPDGSDSESVRTRFVDFPQFKDVIGLMWQVLSHDGFLREIPGSNNDMQRMLQHHQESFVQAFLMADACAKGRTSKVFHRILEGIDCNDFTTRSKLIYEFAEAKREHNHTEMAVSDFCALTPDITEDLLRQAYFKRERYPNQFDDLVQYLNAVSFSRLTDKDDADNAEFYGAHFGVRGHIFGHAKEYLYNHFPIGYPRQRPTKGDCRVLEENYTPRLMCAELNRIIYTAINLNRNKWTELDGFLEAIHQAIENKAMLPPIPLLLRDMVDEDWHDEYGRQCAKIQQAYAASEQEKDFQFAIAAIATRSSREALTVKKQKYQSIAKPMDVAGDSVSIDVDKVGITANGPIGYFPGSSSSAGVKRKAGGELEGNRPAKRKNSK